MFLQNAPAPGLLFRSLGAMEQVRGISNQGAHILDCKGTDLQDHGEVTAPDSINQGDQPESVAADPAVEVDLEAADPAVEVDLEAEGKL